MSRGVFHVPGCSDGSVQRAVQRALLVSRHGASSPRPHLPVTSDPRGCASVVARRHVEGRRVQPEERVSLMTKTNEYDSSESTKYYFFAVCIQVPHIN